ncbi:MAG: HDOD domain-containing protein, partial [Burkholderiales bacterium]
GKPQKSRFEQLKASGKLPSPGGVAMKILRMAQDSDVQLTEVAKTIQADPALLGRILQLANAASNGPRRPATTALDALSLLGLSAVWQLALGLSVVSGHSSGRCERFDYQRFWSRSLATAVALKLLCRHQRVLGPEEGFSCGLLSRVGCIALATLHPKDYGNLVEVTTDKSGDDVLQLERDCFGTDHNELSAALLEDWGMPKVFADAALYHERPNQAKVTNNPRTHMLAYLLHIASFWGAICSSEQEPSESDVRKLFSMARKAGLDDSTLTGMNEELIKEWKDWVKIVDVPTPSTDWLEEQLATNVSGNRVASVAKSEGPAVLVITDNDAKPFSDLLAQIGHRVSAASDVKSGLQILVETDPELIFLDWGMADRQEFMAALRGAKNGADKYVVAMVNAQMQQDDAGLDADDMVSTPLDDKVFRARVRIAQRILQLRAEVRRGMEQTYRYIKDLATANRQWEEASLSDALTGLPNRHYALDRLRQEWALAVRNDRPLCCMLINVDHARRFNDSYGPKVWENIVQNVAHALQRAKQPHEVLCRLSDEKFLVIHPDCPPLGTLEANAERLRRAVEQTPIKSSVLTLGATVSIGVAVRSKSSGSIQALLEQAERAVIEARQNRILVAP